MKNFLNALKISDFVPPIVTRISKKVQRKIYQTRIHPFDCIPDNVSPLWYLDDISREFTASKIDIMKIDVEGFELNVLTGGANFIRDNVDTIIIELSPYRNDSIKNDYIANVFLFMKEAGFTIINIFDIQHITDHASLMLAHMDCVFRNNAKL